jgi:hypothetical protein
MGILRQAGAARPVGGDWGGEAVCGRGAGEGSRRDSITNGTVGSRIASGKCGAGRERSGNGSAVRNLGHASDMWRRNASGENSGPRRLNRHRKASPLPKLHRRTLARGHAAGGIPRFFATVPAVMSPRGILLVPRRRIAGTTAARPCGRPTTANASGCGARPKRGASSDAWNTRPHGPNAVEIVSPSARPPRRGLRRCLARRRGTPWVRSSSIGAMATGP